VVNLATPLFATAARRPRATAVRGDDTVLSYAQLAAGSARVAGHLRARGVGPGDRIGLMLSNVPEFAVLYYGILRAGAVVVPMNPLLKDREIDYYLGDSGAVALFDAGTMDAALTEAEPSEELVERAGNDTAVILYTSGTTGRPKGAELTHANLLRNAEVTARTLMRLTEADTVLGALPLFHSFGQTVALNTVVSTGAALRLVPRFEAAQVLRILADEDVTVFAGVPTMYAGLIQAGRESEATPPALRLCVSGGAALPLGVLQGFEERFDIPVLEGYGLSETSPVACFNHPEAPRKPGTIGTPIAGVAMRVVGPDGAELPDGEIGEIVIAGHNVMKGYWRRPEATGEAIRAGWFHTGDLGLRDDDGYFAIVDRKKDMVIRGGYNVYPREIEEVLYEHPAVAEAAVIGVPHDTLGEEVVAVVALRPGATATSEGLRDFVKEQVAAYKYPRQVFLVDALPKGPTGKILKREITIPSPH
jgi:long-chain acyl-CoA synthetase